MENEEEFMTMEQNANMIEFLQAIGWSGDQITNMILCIAGRITIDDAVRKHKEIASA